MQNVLLAYDAGKAIQFLFLLRLTRCAEGWYIVEFEKKMEQNWMHEERGAERKMLNDKNDENSGFVGVVW